MHFQIWIDIGHHLERSKGWSHTEGCALGIEQIWVRPGNATYQVWKKNPKVIERFYYLIFLLHVRECQPRQILVRVHGWLHQRGRGRPGHQLMIYRHLHYSISCFCLCKQQCLWCRMFLRSLPCPDFEPHADSCSSPRLRKVHTKGDEQALEQSSFELGLVCCSCHLRLALSCPL